MGWFVVIGAVLLVAAIWAVFSLMFRKVAPNEAMIVYGFGITEARVVKGGGTFVLPGLQTERILSLELMSFDVSPRQNLHTHQGIPVIVEAVAQIKVKSDPTSIRTAAEQFLNKTPADRENLIRLVMEGHLRGITGQLSVEEIVKDPEMVARKIRTTCAEDMARMGLEIISFTIKDVRDKNDYILNMSTPENVAIRRVAAIAEAEAARDIAMRQAETTREASVAKAQADQERVVAETASATRQAEAQRNLAVAQAEYATSVQRRKAAADKAYDIESSVQQQQVMAAQIGIDRVQREAMIRVQDAEILRRERELIATMLKPAEVERQKTETLAEAERQRRILEAQGAAEAIRVQGSGQADANRAQGLADADVIRARGQAEAAAMNLRAEAFKQYNEAAVIDRLLTTMPAVMGAISAPLGQVDQITIVSTGQRGGFTNDMTRMIAQLPVLVETLAGVQLGDVMNRVVDAVAPGPAPARAAARPGATPPSGAGPGVIARRVGTAPQKAQQ